MKAALKKVKYQIFAGMLLSAAAAGFAYVLEAREIKAQTARIVAEQIGEIEERIALASAELESTTALIEQAHPEVPVIRDFIDRLALSRAGNVPWLWAYIVSDAEVAALEAEIRNQPFMQGFKIARGADSARLLAPVVMVTSDSAAGLIGTDILVYPELAKLAAEKTGATNRQPPEPLISITFPGLPPNAVYMIRRVVPAAVHRFERKQTSLILRGLPAANLASAAQLKAGQSLRLVDSSVDPPRLLVMLSDDPDAAQWFPPAEFSVGEHKLRLSLSEPGDQTRPGWWALVAITGILLTGLYAALRSGSIVGARATQLGTILTSTEQRLAETQRRETTFFENAGTANCETDFVTGQLVRVNDSMCHMLLYKREELVGRTFKDITHPDDIEFSRSQLVDAKGQPKSHLQLEKRYLRKDGTAMWGLVNSKLYFDTTGQPQSYMTVIINIDDRKRDETTKSLLTRELAHRVRNTVQLTSSLARQTSATARSVKDYDQKFHRRLAALSAAQDVLFDRNWMSAPLPQIARAIIKPFLPEDRRQGELSVSLPEVELPTQQAQTIALALHELASNSSKYGALSNGGTVNLVGILQEAGEGETRILQLRWEERSTKPIRKPRRSGFGMRMLMSAMPEQFGGHATATWRRNGLLYEAWLNLPEA